MRIVGPAPQVGASLYTVSAVGVPLCKPRSRRVSDMGDWVLHGAPPKLPGRRFGDRGITGVLF